MKFKSMRERLLASSMICGAALFGISSQAAAQSDEVSEVVVTGTRNTESKVVFNWFSELERLVPTE